MKTDAPADWAREQIADLFRFNMSSPGKGLGEVAE